MILHLVSVLLGRVLVIVFMNYDVLLKPQLLIVSFNFSFRIVSSIEMYYNIRALTTVGSDADTFFSPAARSEYFLLRSD